MVLVGGATRGAVRVHVAGAVWVHVQGTYGGYVHGCIMARLANLASVLNELPVIWQN